MNGTTRGEIVDEASNWLVGGGIVTMALAPLALGLGAGSALLRPLALAVVGGFVLSAPLLLLVLPRFLAHSGTVAAMEQAQPRPGS